VWRFKKKKKTGKYFLFFVRKEREKKGFQNLKFWTPILPSAVSQGGGRCPGTHKAGGKPAGF
jgi:hypothetical protein